MATANPIHKFRKEQSAPPLASSQVIDQPKTQPEQLLDFNWAVTFEQRFPVVGKVNQDQFIQMAREQMEWLKTDFIKRLEEYPTELLKVLNKYDLLDKPTFQQK